MKKKWIKPLVFVLFIVLISSPIHARSIREVSQNIDEIKSIEPPFHFAVIGDSRDGKKVYTRLLQRILERKPSFIVHLGDMITKPHEKEWREFFEISGQINLPFFPVAGNHDVGSTLKGEDLYRKQFFLPGGEIYYAFRTGDHLFIVLDSEKGKGRIIDEEWSWLENILSSSDEALKSIFLHRPLFLPMGSLKIGKAMDRYPFDRDELHRLFLKTKVKAVFAGDDHRYDRMEKDNILYLITGGGGAPLSTFEDRGGYFHYVWISVKRGRMEGEVVDLKGGIRDRFVVE